MVNAVSLDTRQALLQGKHPHPTPCHVYRVRKEGKTHRARLSWVEMLLCSL